MPRPPLLLPTLAATVFLSLAAPTAGKAAEGAWQTAAAGVAATIAEAEAAFAKGDAAGAKKAITDAYFRKFEDSKFEIVMRKEISARRAAEVEGMFAELRKAVTAGDKAAVAKVAAELKAALAADARKLDDAKVPVPQ